MADKISKEQRSNNMRAIKSQSQLENLFTKALWSRGIRFRKNVRKLKGTPDIVIKKYKIVIFVDSCFWHACPQHFNRPKTNQDFWDAKIKRNIERDKEVTDYYIENGWNIKRIWEHQIRKNLELTIEDTVNFIIEAKKKK